MPNLNTSEQWKHGGDCEKCRRKNYCSKPCKANDQLTQARFMGHFFNAMANVMFKPKTNTTTED